MTGPATSTPRTREAARDVTTRQGKGNHPAAGPRASESTESLPTDHQRAGDPATAYQHLIRRGLDRLGLPGMDPRHVEASMRCAFGTLDHLGGSAWDRAVADAVAEVQAMGPEISEALAQSWGLWQPARRNQR